MAIAFAQVSIHSRSKGHSAIAASSYRTGSKLYDMRTGLTHDYSNRDDVIYSEILLPEGSSPEFADREFLWNQVELAENRSNSQICKDIVLALPKELSIEHQIALTKQFAATHFVQENLVADIAIHNHGDGNPHAHILITTRRLEHNKFSRHKARDLNPTFAKKFIVEKDYWGERWRDFQNNYFAEHKLDLIVDPNHLISERHTGRMQDEYLNYLEEENQLIRTARTEIALSNPEVFIEKIMLTHSVFTRRDIERLVFKTFHNTQHSSDYLNIVAQVLEHNTVVNLGKNERGMESYTTQEQYMREGRLLAHVEQLYLRRSYSHNNSLDFLIQHYRLNEEQTEALKFIASGNDISVLIGRPGVGKSYLLKPLKEHYESNNNYVLGASLSGKVAKALQSETGIASSTIASLIYRLRNNQIALTKDNVLVVDEAGMIDFSSMAYLIESVNKAGAKIILVGDPDQLKPIHKGEIFRGIAARVGYIELEQITRQKNLEDRKASLALARGQVNEAIEHYSSKRAVHFADECDEAVTSLINKWGQQKDAQSIKEHTILAFTKASVALLNEKARAVLQQKEVVGQEEYEYQSQNGTQKIKLALGERILFRQNNKDLGVRNGELATITHININAFQATLDSGEQVIIPKSYSFIDYGYALTVHKSQGMTCDHVSVFVDSPYWNKNLAFVAMTRHRESLNIYASKHHHSDLQSLTKTLSRTSIKDNVIDWPLDFAIRAGFEPDSLIGKTISKLTKAAHLIKDNWNYIVNYEAYLNTQKLKSYASQNHLVKAVGHQIARILDEAADLRKQFRLIDKEARQQGIKQSEHNSFDALYKRSLDRDKSAASLITEQKGFIEQNGITAKGLDAVKSYAERHERYKAITNIAHTSQIEKLSEDVINQASFIDLQKDRYHVNSIAKACNKSPELLITQIKHLQQLHKERAWDVLCKKHPELIHYEQLSMKNSKTVGLIGEQHRQKLQAAAAAIMINKDLMSALQRTLPTIAKIIQQRGVSQQPERTF